MGRYPLVVSHRGHVRYRTPAAAFDYEYRAFRKDSTPGSTFT